MRGPAIYQSPRNIQVNPFLSPILNLSQYLFIHLFCDLSEEDQDSMRHPPLSHEGFAWAFRREVLM